MFVARGSLDAELTFVKNLVQGLTHRLDQHDNSFKGLDSWTKERQAEIHNLLTANIGNAIKNLDSRVKRLELDSAKDTDSIFRRIESLESVCMALNSRIETSGDLSNRINDLAKQFDNALVSLRDLINKRHKAQNTRIYKERRRLENMVDSLSRDKEQSE